MTPGWFPAKVIFSLEEMAKVQTTFANDMKQECWVELESHKIAQLNTFTKNDKSVNHSYFMDLYKLIEPSGTGNQSAYSNEGQ